MEGRPSRWTLAWRRLIEPIALRKHAAVALLILAAAVGLGVLLGGRAGSALVVLGWVLLGPVAVALGYGEGFFVGHGRGARRATLVLILSAIASLATCVTLSTGVVGDSGAGSRAARAIVTLVLFVTLGLLTASLAALGFGLGTGYLARKIAERGGDEWP